MRPRVRSRLHVHAGGDRVLSMAKQKPLTARRVKALLAACAADAYGVTPLELSVASADLVELLQAYVELAQVLTSGDACTPPAGPEGDRLGAIARVRL